MVSVIGGLPGETAGDFLTTLAFVESLQVATYAHNTLMLLPGTPLHEDGERHGLRADRDPVSGQWRTHHAYDVHAVKPLPGSQVRGERWDEAGLLTAGLCGRPRPELAAEGAAWAVVLHECRPDPAVAGWLLDVLAIQGAVLVVEMERSLGAEDWRRWAGLFTGASLPLGLLALLSPEAESSGRRVLRSIGTLGEHRFELATSWDSAGTGVGADGAGNCSIPVWLASDPSSRPPVAVPATLFDPSPQIAHGCRWWPGRGSCGAPRVLHVRADGLVGSLLAWSSHRPGGRGLGGPGRSGPGAGDRRGRRPSDGALSTGQAGRDRSGGGGRDRGVRGRRPSGLVDWT